MASATKLSTSEIFDRIRVLTCQIHSPHGVTSGVLIDASGHVLSVIHNIPIVKGEGAESHFTLDKVQLLYNQKYFPPLFPRSFVGTNGQRLDLAVFASPIQIDQSQCIPILPDDFVLKEGMKAYFAGFPLTQSSITFHRGVISSISENEGIRRFTIDGTVVPGNSGGPVVIQYEGKLYIAGIMISEVADLDPEFLFVETSFETMRKQGGVGGMVLGLKYPDGQVRSTSPLDIIGMALTVIKRNMSTGVGRAIDARHYKNLFSEAPVAASPYEDLDVKKPLRGAYKVEQIAVLEYMEHFPGNARGPGPRGISIKHIGISQVLTYRFDLNPHDLRGYNKNQSELYAQAAANFHQIFSAQGAYPQSFNFDAYKTQFTATLQG